MIEVVNPISGLNEARTAKLQEQAKHIQGVFMEHVRRTRGKQLTGSSAELGRIASSEVFLGSEAKQLG